MEPFYRIILKRAWKVAWKNKWLWIFGCFATFLGSWTVYELLVRIYSNFLEKKSLFFTISEYVNSSLFGIFSWDKIVQLWRTDNSLLILSLFSLLFGVIMIVIFIILAILSQGAIIKSAISYDQEGKITFFQAFAAGRKNFGQLLKLNIFMKVIVIGIILLLSYLISLMWLGDSVINAIVYAIGLAVIIVLLIVMYFITIYSAAFVVLRSKNFWTSLRYAWFIFHKNLLINLEMALIMFMISFVWILTMMIILIFVLSPLFVLRIFFIYLDMFTAQSIIAISMLVLFIIVTIVTTSFFTVFQISSWSILFEELALKRGKSKLMRLVYRLLGK